MQTLRQDQHYTYSDYLTWDDEMCYELIDGVPYMMSPAPSQSHQEVSRELLRQLANFLVGKPCKVFSAPFDVRLNFDKEDDIVVQPDLLVVCDMSKLDGKCCAGAPDMVIEISSPFSSSRDTVLKFNKYLKAGVREYWIVNPDSKVVSVHILEKNKYMTDAYGETDTIPVHVLEGCHINLHDVFSY